MTKFTEGEWEIIRDMNGVLNSVRVKEWELNDLMGDYQGCIICDFTNSHGMREHAYEECEANARLISKAPDMLDALKMARDFYKSELDEMGSCDHEVGVCFCGVIEQYAQIDQLIRYIENNA